MGIKDDDDDDDTAAVIEFKSKVNPVQVSLAKNIGLEMRATR